MAKLLSVQDGRQLLFDCPGCGISHVYRVKSDFEGPVWIWNGDMDRPSFAPSLLCKFPRWNGSEMVEQTCHLFVTDGRIEFLSDCTHALAGKTVDLPDQDNKAE